MSSRLVTEWSTDDPQIARSLRTIADETDPLARLELEAALHTFQAAWCLRQAGALRARRTPLVVKPRASCLGCRQEVSVNAAGELRPHGPVDSRCRQNDGPAYRLTCNGPCKPRVVRSAIEGRAWAETHDFGHLPAGFGVIPRVPLAGPTPKG